MTPPISVGSRDAQYWDGVAHEWAARARDSSWRSYADTLNVRWVSAWLSPTPVAALLKTDAFEEVAGEMGLHATLAARAGTVVSVDVSSVMLGHARRRHADLHPVCGRVESLPIRDGAFDAIVSTSTLDHLETLDDVAASLAELRRVLRPGGRLMLTIDNRRNPVIWLRSVLPHLWLRRAGVVPYETGANCGPTTLAALAVGAGLEPLAVGSLMHCPRLPVIALCWMADRVGSGRMKDALVRAMLALERLGRWPTRFLTGYFVTLVATRSS